MPIGTIPVSSGRREGEEGGRMRAEDSDGAVRRVTISEEVWAEAVMLDMRLVSKKARQRV